MSRNRSPGTVREEKERRKKKGKKWGKVSGGINIQYYWQRHSCAISRERKRGRERADQEQPAQLSTTHCRQPNPEHITSVSLIDHHLISSAISAVACHDLLSVSLQPQMVGLRDPPGTYPYCIQYRASFQLRWLGLSLCALLGASQFTSTSSLQWLSGEHCSSRDCLFVLEWGMLFIGERERDGISSRETRVESSARCVDHT